MNVRNIVDVHTYISIQYFGDYIGIIWLLASLLYVVIDHACNTSSGLRTGMQPRTKHRRLTRPDALA